MMASAPLELERWLDLAWREEQSNNKPGGWMLMNVTDEKVCVVPLYHLSLEPLAELTFPPVTIFQSPTTVRLGHLPISTR
jgi:hypothetical protein